jgi:hypothetical protein
MTHRPGGVNPGTQFAPVVFLSSARRGLEQERDSLPP